jgi:hypothetical protein
MWLGDLVNGVVELEAEKRKAPANEVEEGATDGNRESSLSTSHVSEIRLHFSLLFAPQTIAWNPIFHSK